MKYFVQTIRFLPNIPEGLNLQKIDEDKYVLKEDQSIWKYRELLDLGWGREHGFIRLPILTFEQLLYFVFDVGDEQLNSITDSIYNFYGALAVLMYDYAEQFFGEILKRFRDDNFNVINNRFMIKQLNAEFNIDEELVKRLHDRKFAQNCLLWKKIYDEINKRII